MQILKKCIAKKVVIISGTNDRRDVSQAGFLGCAQSSFARNEFVVIADFAYDDTSGYEDGGDYEIVVESIAGASCAHGYLLAIAQ